MCVKVYSGSVLVEMRTCLTEEEVQKYADFWQDSGYRVRIES
jgi:hypothetical protein